MVLSSVVNLNPAKRKLKRNSKEALEALDACVAAFGLISN
jgi:hypothetical protein